MTVRTKRRYIISLRKAIDRARYLARALVTFGRYEKANETTHIPAIDERDLVAFIFLEVSAKFESFAYLAFQYDVCRWYGITSTRSEFVVGSSDLGTQRVFGWAIPERLSTRGRNLLSKRSIFGNLKESIGEVLYQTLTIAHQLRNRIAHDPAIARTPINEIAIALGVPPAERRGLSVGRLLREYPVGSTFDESYFEIFLEAYEDFAELYARY
jgi:hypothetical protein